MENYLSVQFYEDSIRYYNAAMILSSSEQRELDDQLLITPITYLCRHSIELILKALIIKFLESFNNSDIDNFMLCTVNGISTNKKLLNSHSLYSLMECLKYFDNKDKIASMFESKEINFIDKIIKNIDNIDYGSDYFRYPIGKNQKQQHKRKFLNMSETNIMPDISNIHTNYILETNDNKVIAFTAIEKKYIQLSEDIKNVANILINKYKKTP